MDEEIVNDKLTVHESREILKPEQAEPQYGIVVRERNIQLAATLMDIAKDNMRRDIVRIAVEEFDYIVRRRREIAEDTIKNEGVLEFIKKKEFALKAGEFEIDTISGKLIFFNKDLQPWL